MKAGVLSGRAALAAAITRRNGAAKAAEAAREAFEACAGPEAVSYIPGEGRIGQKFADLRSARYDAADRLAEIAERQKNYLETNAGDRVGLHRIFLHEHGKNADDTFTDARRKLDDAEKAEAEMAAAMSTVDLVLTDAEREFADANEAVEANVQAILHVEAVRLASALASDARAILRKVGELAFVTRGVNFQHRDVDHGHPMHEAKVVLRWLSSIGQFTGVADEMREIETARQEGAAPWVAATSRLAIDANAPLPTDPKLSVAA